MAASQFVGGRAAAQHGPDELIFCWFEAGRHRLR
jgi:hypothetical protein